MKIETSIANQIAEFLEKGNSIFTGNLATITFKFKNGKFVREYEDRREAETSTSFLTKAEFIEKIQSYKVEDFYKLQENLNL